jgi:hypothetical protein
MNVPLRKRFDPRMASFEEAKAYFASHYGSYIAQATDQESLNEMVNGVQSVGSRSRNQSPRREALIYLMRHGVQEQDLKRSQSEIRASIRIARGALFLTAWNRFRFWLLDILGRHKR